MNITWESAYNCHTAKVGIITLHVNWVSERGGGYEVIVEGANTARLTELSKDIADGKRRAIALAIKKMTAAMDMLVNADAKEGD